VSARVLLAGEGTPSSAQDHHRDMYRPATRALGLVEVYDLDEADLVVVCPDVTRPDVLAKLLEEAGDRPVVLDKPTLFPTDVLADLAERFPRVLAAHHPRFHPAVATATGRVRSGTLGLVHAIHGELLVGPGDGPHPLGELRNLAVYALDVVQSLAGGHGPLTGTAYAVSAPAGPDGAGESHTIALRLEPDIAVTLLVARGGPSGRVPGGAPTFHRYRILGSHGQLLVDLDSPVLDLLGGPRLPFGPGSVERLLEAALAGVTTPGLADACELSHLIDALVASASTHDVITLGGDR